jgi:hypothetical protein
MDQRTDKKDIPGEVILEASMDEFEKQEKRTITIHTNKSLLDEVILEEKR